MKPLSVTMLVSALLSSIASAADQQLVLGRSDFTMPWATQFVLVRNGARPVKSAHVECGFFLNGRLLGTDGVSVRNLAADEEGYGRLMANTKAQPDDIKCRIGEVIE
jgi:hypothetical protein